MTKPFSKRKKFVLNLIVVIPVSVMLIVLLLYLTDSLVMSDPKNFDFNSSDPNDSNQKYEGTMLLKSKSFSEYSPIDVDITLRVTNGTQYPTLYAVFPDSHNLPYESTGFGTGIGGGWIPLTMKSPNYYEGQRKIEYQVADEYWFGVTYDLPKEIVGPKSTVADNRIVIKEKGWGYPTVTDKMTLTFIILPIAGVIIFGRWRVRKFFFQATIDEQQDSPKRGDRNNQPNSTKGKKRAR